MRRIVALALIIVIVTVGCRPKPKSVSISLPSHTAIELMLARKLEAGTDDKGNTVPMVVTEDVTSPDGRVLIAKGALAYGLVQKSRSEGTLSSMLNQPARLEVKLHHVVAVDGQQVLLTADPQDESKPYAFTRANTGEIKGVQNVERVWNDAEKQKLLVELLRVINESKNSDMANDPNTDELLTKISCDMDLQFRNLDRKGRDRVASLLGSIGNGRVDEKQMAAIALPEITALLEFTKLAGIVGQRLGGALKGRTIRAYVGTPMTVYTAESKSILVKPKED